MILGTDFSSRDNAPKFIRVIPSPSLPKVRETDEEIFLRQDFFMLIMILSRI